MQRRQSRKGVIALALVGTLSGCMQTVWSKPGATAQDFYRNKLACQLTANSGTPGYMAAGNPQFVMTAALINAEAKNNMFADCMQADGWTPQRKPRN
jgi:hypothetical protein